jgi:hypothetical protein
VRVVVKKPLSGEAAPLVLAADEAHEYGYWLVMNKKNVMLSAAEASRVW